MESPMGGKVQAFHGDLDITQFLPFSYYRLLCCHSIIHVSTSHF